MIEITTEFGKGTYTPVNTSNAVMAGPPKKEPTLIDAVEAAINYCVKAINTLEEKKIDARKDMCALLTLKEELLNDKIPPSAQKFLFNHLEDNL